MARVVYGVSGEGSGHSSRARELLTHLLAAGHEVRVASYDRGYANLCDDFDVLEIEGLSIATVDNRVSVVRTFTENVAKLSSGVKRLRELRHELFRDFEPHAVLTDFEPMTAYLAHHYQLPLVSVDNQHRMRYMRYPCPPHLTRDAKVTEAVIRMMVPRPDVALVTTFWYGELLNERTFLFPPILRRAVRELEPTLGGHVLVYATKAFDDLLEKLAEFPSERFLVYGFDEEGERGPLSFRPFSRAGFLDDLASAKAVIATAGFTLLTESLYLAKPMLALPMRGQFEQELNALLLEESGYGRNGRELDGRLVGEFLADGDRYRAALADYDSGDPAQIGTQLDELLADDAARARDFRARRKSRG